MRCFQPNPSYRPHTCPSLIQQKHSKGVISNDTLTTFLPCNVQLYYHTKFHFYVNLHTSTIPLHCHFCSFCRCFRPETTHFINASTLSPTRFFRQLGEQNHYFQLNKRLIWAFFKLIFPFIWNFFSRSSIPKPLILGLLEEGQIVSVPIVPVVPIMFPEVQNHIFIYITY